MDTAKERCDENHDAALLRAILETAAEGILTIDVRGAVLSMNPAAVSMFGFSEHEVVGRNISMLMPEPYRSLHDGYIAAYLRTGKARIIGIGREVEGMRRDGTVFPLGLAISEVRLAAGPIFTGIVRDLSARREAEEQARIRLGELTHASRLLELGEMTSGLAHEINQPLTAIVSFAQACRRMVEAGTADDELLRDTLGRIITQGERAAQIVRSLRSFARKHDDTRELLAPGDLIAEVLDLLSHDIRRSGVDLEVHASDSAGQAEVNRIQIEQVVVNLVRNAIEAMESTPRGQRRLRVSAERGEHGGPLISVIDSGCGLPGGDADRLFDPFFTTKSDGMGVGLAISRTIAQVHGATLKASNRPEGGAEFVLNLAAADD